MNSNLVLGGYWKKYLRLKIRINTFRILPEKVNGAQTLLVKQ